jgi:phosphoribosylamine--glycine ligase
VNTNVLVVGAGGREHSIAWKLAQSSAVDEVICAPGNPGMEAIGACLDVDTAEPLAIADLADKVDASLVVIGPETPLVAGAADVVRERGRLCFGPSAAAARLEGSKAWMKDVLVAAGVPTARHRTFQSADDLGAASAFLHTLDGLYVVKTDGLAGGKGVVVTESLSEAREVVHSYLSGAAFGGAGSTCVIEEGLVGPELSLFALCDGTRAELFVCAQDYKRVGDGDSGPNTGGMGAYSPVPLASDALAEEVMARAVNPTLEELRRRGAEYRGVLYCGLMITADGPKVIEYNIRFGDPECQILMRRLRSDLYAHLAEAAAGGLTTPAEFTDDSAVIVVLASEGYPMAPRKGDLIEGLDAAATVEGVVVFHADTRRSGDGVFTNGGRVLGVTATAPDLAGARRAAYDAAARVSWPGIHYRHDIGARGLS